MPEQRVGVTVAPPGVLQPNLTPNVPFVSSALCGEKGSLSSGNYSKVVLREKTREGGMMIMH